MSARGAVLLAAALGGACGDNVHVDDVFEPTSGARLKLEWHLYDDGTRQAETSVFYDITVHARCTPQRWVDDVIRCVPIAEDAVYVDATCENLVGRARAIEKPTHFIGYDALGGTTLPARLYRAGLMTTPAEAFYERRDGACVGPFTNPSDLTYYQLVDEIAGSDLVELREDEVGLGRLGVRFRATDDGVRVPIGLRDRDLDLPCTPTPRPDGSVGCAPTEIAAATLFQDPACEHRVITISPAAEPPAIATVPDPSGCTRYHAVAGEVAGPLYRRDGDACTKITPTPPRRVFAIGAELDLPTLGRRVEEVPGHRLQRILLGDGELRFVDERLYDTATRADCRRRALGEVARCLPAVLADAKILMTSGCAVAVHVAEIPQHTCERPAFAVTLTEEGMDLRAIGDRTEDALYQLVGASCQPYVAAPDTVLRSLGPPIAPETFPAAVSYGER